MLLIFELFLSNTLKFRVVELSPANGTNGKVGISPDNHQCSWLNQKNTNLLMLKESNLFNTNATNNNTTANACINKFMYVTHPSSSKQQRNYYLIAISFYKYPLR
jgi:hypothetical protein